MTSWADRVVVVAIFDAFSCGVVLCPGDRPGLEMRQLLAKNWLLCLMIVGVVVFFATQNVAVFQEFEGVKKKPP